MTKFFLNDKEVTAEENETIWQVAKKKWVDSSSPMLFR